MLLIRYHTEGTYSSMSLKAKLEAVIYAAEEPVTLAQLATLFVDEALEWKAEQEAAAEAARASEPVEEVAPLLEGVALEEAAEAAVAEVEAQESVTPETPVAAEPEPTTEVATEAPPAEEKSPEEMEAEARQQAKQREREAKAVLRTLLDALIADYVSDERGVEIREIAGGYRMATKPSCHDAVRGFVKNQKPPLKLSLPALETLAVIAYKQPVTAPEVNEIRGVESSGVFGSLLARKLIATAGRKQVIGRPILYKTTKEFLLRFGLKDLSELPSMEEFEKMAASELEEPGQANDVDETAADAVLAPETAEEATAGEADAEAAPEAESAPAEEPVKEPAEAASEETNAVEASEAEKETDNPAPEDAPAEPPPAL